MGAASVEIYDIMACNVYMDFENTGLQKEQHKFLVAFYPTPGVFAPDLIEKITATGPGGYTMEIAQQKFNNQNKNGYITDPAYGSCWYMLNLATGWMKEGEYKIEVRCKNGEVKTKSRYQKQDPTEALVTKAYLKNRDEIFNSHAPSLKKKLPAGASLQDVNVTWDPLKKLARQDAFYIFRVCEGKTGKEFDVQRLVWWDNVFVNRMSNPDAGKNIGQVTIGNPLTPKNSYTYFNEITDSNAMGETNICIFQPHQVFATP